jgi:pyruvate formate lyase activating enzyme
MCIVAVAVRGCKRWGERFLKEMDTKSTSGSSGGNPARRPLVLGIMRMTIHNGPGFRTLVLFKGGPLRCLWCSTPEGQNPDPEIALYPEKCTRCGSCVSVCPLIAISLTGETVCLNRSLCNICGKCVEVCYPGAIEVLGQAMTVGDLLREVKKDAVLYKHSGGGVTISGGEPLQEVEFVENFLRACQEEAISVGVDTCGHVPWENIERVLPYVDFFLWDIKHIDPEKHREMTGVYNKLILSNVRAVSERGIPLYIRIPLIPGYTDSEENIRGICELVRSLGSTVRVDLLPMHHLGKARYESLNRPYPMADVSPISDEALEKLRQMVESYGFRCDIGG